MTNLRTLAATISSRPGQAAIAIALILNASAAFAEGDRTAGRRFAKQALSAQALVYDEPQDDTVLTPEERDQLRSIATEIRQAIRDRGVKQDFVGAAAVDLISTAGMVSRRRADADASLRMVLTFTDKKRTSADEDSSFRDLGFPLRLDGGTLSTIKFDRI